MLRTINREEVPECEPQEGRASCCANPKTEEGVCANGIIAEGLLSAFPLREFCGCVCQIRPPTDTPKRLSFFLIPRAQRVVCANSKRQEGVCANPIPEEGVCANLKREEGVCANFLEGRGCVNPKPLRPKRVCVKMKGECRVFEMKSEHFDELGVSPKETGEEGVRQKKRGEGGRGKQRERRDSETRERKRRARERRRRGEGEKTGPGERRKRRSEWRKRRGERRKRRGENGVWKVEKGEGGKCGRGEKTGREGCVVRGREKGWGKREECGEKRRGERRDGEGREKGRGGVTSME